MRPCRIGTRSWTRTADCDSNRATGSGRSGAACRSPTEPRGTSRRIDRPQAARSLGADRYTTFRRITLPIIKPGIISGALFCFIISFDLFNISLLLKGIGIATLPIQLFDYVRWDFDPTAAAVSTVSIIVTVIALVIAQRLIGLRSLRF